MGYSLNILGCFGSETGLVSPCRVSFWTFCTHYQGVIRIGNRYRVEIRQIGLAGVL